MPMVSIPVRSEHAHAIDGHGITTATWHIGCSFGSTLKAILSKFCRTAHQFRGTAGFTLMEAMISSIILALAVTTALTILSHATKYVNDMRLRARSAQIVQQKVEDLRLLSWSNLTSSPSTFTDASDTNKLYAGKLVMSTYQSYGTTQTIKQVTVQVTWTNTHRMVMTNSLTTLISNGGLNGSTL